MNTPILTDRTCLTCKHKVIERQGSEKQMFCRRNPPQATVLLMPGKGGVPTPVPVAAFPPVQPEMFCGEHKPRIEHGHAGGFGSLQPMDA